MRKSYDERISKLKAELDRQRDTNKELLNTNNAMQSKLYESMNGDGVVG
jgi:hypothetical protein